MKEAIILAGGLGRRLRPLTGRMPKYIYKIFNYPLIIYPLYTLSYVGVDNFIIVVCKEFRNNIEKTIENYVSDKLSVNITYVENPYPNSENGYSLFLGLERLESKSFVLSMADHIYPPSVVNKLINNYSGKHDVLVGGDSKAYYVSKDEATKILATSEGGLLEISKKLKDFTHIDIGLFVFNKVSLENMIERIGVSINTPLSGLLTRACRYGFNIHVFDIDGGYWTDIDLISDVEKVLNGEWRIVVEKTISEWKRDE